MRGNTISIELPLKRGKVSKTIPLYQYDYGQKLLITGAELPEYYEVHFSNEMHGEAVTSLGDSTGVLIPDALLETGENVYLWLYLHADSDDGETEFQGAIPVIKRARVTDQTPTPAEQSVITQAIAALTAASAEATAAKEDAEAAQQHIENMGVAATTLPTDSDATVTKTVNASGEVTLTFGLPRGVKGDRGDRGLQGETGNDGADGADGFSPVVSLTKSGKVTTFSVTDAEDTYSVEINDGEDGTSADLIDDEAGEGDTDKTWSADKLETETSALLTEINSKADELKTDIDGMEDLLGIGDPVLVDTMPNGYKSAAYSNAAGTNKYKWENDVLVLKKGNGSFGEINSTNAGLSIGESTTFVVDQSKSVYLDFAYENENDDGIAVIVIRYYADNFTDYDFVNLPIPVGTGTASIDLKQVAIDNEISATRKNVFIRSIKLIEETGKTAKFAEADISGFGVLVQPENRLDTIEGDIDNLETDVSDIKDFDNAIRNPVNLYEALYEDLGYLDEETGGIRNFNVTYIEKLSAFIPVTAGEVIHYQAWASGDPHGRIGYFNSSKVYVSYEDIPSANRTSSYAYLDKAVPTGISYIRFAYYGFGNGKACITRENIPTGWIPAYVDLGSKVFNNALTYPIRGINHRGFAEEAPENTMPAFILSKQKGFDMIETDVQFTSDNVPVLLHDPTINRTARNADGTEIQDETPINSITYAESQEYDFGIWFDSSFAGTKIPKFEDFIIMCKQIGIHPYIELKNDIVYTDEQLLMLIAIVNEHDMMHLCTWKSFALSQLRVIKRNAPTARLGYLVSTVTGKRVSEAIALRTQYNDVFIDALVTNLTSELIALVKNSGVTLEAYGVNTLQTMLDLKDVLTGATSDEYNFPVVVRNSILGN